MDSSRFYVSPVFNASQISRNSVKPSFDTNKLVVVGQQLRLSQDVRRAADKTDLTVLYSDTGLEFINDDGIIFVFKHFEGTSFTTLKECRRHRIISASLLKHLDNSTEQLIIQIPYQIKPLYCLTMKNVIMTFDSFKNCPNLDRRKMSYQASYMGALLKDQLNSNITHFVTNTSDSDSYKSAVGLDIQIMTWDWISYCWENRDIELDPEIVYMEYRWKPFQNLLLMFYGFLAEDEKSMIDLTRENGGDVTTDPSQCTHLVVNEKQVKLLKDVDLSESAYVVNSDWFWSSIMILARALEQLSPFARPISKKKYHQAAAGHDGDWLSLTPEKKQRPEQNEEILKSKPKQQEFLNQLVTEVDPQFHNRSMTEDADQSCTEDSVDKAKKQFKRKNIINELYKTECNYVDVLDAIVKIIKYKAESPKQMGGAILNAQESKEVFGGIVPIRSLHQNIKEELYTIINTTSDEQVVGSVFSEKSDNFLKCYPPFINYFEKVRESIEKYKEKKPRFKALLNCSQNIPECKKQTLVELMIRPVQRLPSVQLVLKEIHKNTPRGHIDSEPLDLALGVLSNVLSKLNQNKKQSEEYLKMFDVTNKIADVPSTLVSSNRSLIAQEDCLEISKVFKMPRHEMTLFIFSDCLMVTKKRSHSAKSHPYRYLRCYGFSSIKRLLQIQNNEGDKDLVGAIVMDNCDRVSLLAFKLVDGETQQVAHFIRLVAINVCNFNCFSDHESFVAYITRRDLSLPFNDPRKGGTIEALKRTFSRFSIGGGSFKKPHPVNLQNIKTNNLYSSQVSLASTCSTVSNMSLYNQDYSGLNETVIDMSARRREAFVQGSPSSVHLLTLTLLSRR